MDLTSLLVGVVAGFIVAAIVFTPTGKVVTGRVGRAAGERIAYHIVPR
jgi:hypothetical protein